MRLVNSSLWRILGNPPTLETRSETSTIRALLRRQIPRQIRRTRLQKPFRPFALCFVTNDCILRLLLGDLHPLNLGKSTTVDVKQPNYWKLCETRHSLRLSLRQIPDIFEYNRSRFSDCQTFHVHFGICARIPQLTTAFATIQEHCRLSHRSSRSRSHLAQPSFVD